MRAIIVCVDYADFLKITLPYNSHHFEEVMIVTSERDFATVEVAEFYRAEVFKTNSFFEGGAFFNKWKALEQGLDCYGRHGIICILDADILWPRRIHHLYEQGNLYVPRRRIAAHVKTGKLIPEKDWEKYPLSMEEDFAGYSQIFHGKDPALPKPPWHELDWKHAGGADTAFQNLWGSNKKIRTEWNVLHLGQTNTNWCGRSKKNELKALLQARKTAPQDNPFEKEKLK